MEITDLSPHIPLFPASYIPSADKRVWLCAGSG